MGNLKRSIIKTFDELTITDDFMFGKVMRDPKNLKPLLEFVLGVKIARLDYPELQKTIDSDYDSKGVRLDVYCEDDEKSVYAIEIQTSDEKNLPKRIRYYRDMIDVNILDKGMDYNELKKSFVIFICTFDFFKDDRYIYTFVNQCQENNKIFLNDESTSIVLNVNGTLGEIDEELKGALRYMAGQAPSGSYAKSLAAAVQEAKVNKQWRRDYMFFELKLREFEKECEERGIERGIEIGTERGIEIGTERGIEIGTERGKEIGSIATNVSQVRKAREKGSREQILMFLDITPKLYDEISEMIDDYPDKNDWEIAEAILAENE